MPEPIANIPFDLAGLEDLARKASPQLAKEVDAELDSAPEPAIQPDEVAPDPVPEPETPVEPEPEAGAEVESETSIEDELGELNRQSEEAKSKPAPAPEAKPAEASKEAPVPQRDSDLSLDNRQSAAMHPKTKKIIEERNQKIIVERNKAEALAKEKEALAVELNQARDALKKGVIPKDTEEELTKLRETVREFDIQRDPSLQAKYDAPLSKNQGQILKVLQSFGVGKTVDGKDDPEAVSKLQRDGLNFKTVTPFIKKLSDEGYEEEAEQLRELLRDNIRIKSAKEEEISSWKTNFSAKKEQSIAEQRQNQEKTVSEIREHSQRILNSDISALSKDLPYLQRPSEPLPTDSAAVSKSKQDAIASYDAMAKQISDAVSELDVSRVSPDKVAEVNGRVSANAVQSIIFKQHVLPKLMKDLADLRARNTELEAKFGKIKTAGTLSRAHAAAASAPAGAKATLPESNEDAARQIAKEMGVSID
jgi:hypothetical protein